MGTLQVTISPAKKNSLSPKGKVYSTNEQELPTAAPEPYAGAYTPERRSPAITPVTKFDPTQIVESQKNPAPVPANVSVPSGPICVSHPERPAAGVCVYSGKFYCNDCLVEVEGKLYGKENLSQVVAAVRQSAAPPPTASPPSQNVTHVHVQQNNQTNEDGCAQGCGCLITLFVIFWLIGILSCS